MWVRIRRKRGGFSGNAAPIGVRELLKAMPWPCTFQNILSGVHITISDIPAERTHMSTYRQTLLHDLTAGVAFLTGEARIDSYHLMTSSRSLLFKDIKECAPTGVHNALSEMVIFHQMTKGRQKQFFGSQLQRFCWGWLFCWHAAGQE